MSYYQIKLTFKYSDTVSVEAESEKEAIKLALESAEEEYECFYDAEVMEIED